LSPKIKALREDILRPPEVKLYLKMADRSDKKCLIAILYGYGKRISEVLNLKRQDIDLNGPNISIKFHVLKRKPKSGILPIFNKRLSKDHYLAPFIIDHVEAIQVPESWIFPGYSGGHIHRYTAWRWLKKISEDLWPHLFRHSLAQLMADSGATAFQIKNFFDWVKLETATNYIRESPAMSNHWASREF